MKLKNIQTIISREYMTRIKKKSFLLITFLGPIFFAAICVLPAIIMNMTTEDKKNVAVVDGSGFVSERLQDTDLIDFTDYSCYDADSLKANMNSMGIDILVQVERIPTDTTSVLVRACALKPISVDMKGAISQQVSDAVEDYRLESYGQENLKQIMQEVEFEAPVIATTIDENGKENVSAPEVYMIVSLLMAMIIYMFIAMFSGMVMQSVIEEKASRVVEVLVSSVKATELMFGKIIGVACVAVTQFLLWIVLTVGLVYGISSFVGFDVLMGSATAQTEQMNQMNKAMGIDGEQNPMVPSIPDIDQIAPADVTAVTPEDTPADAPADTLTALSAESAAQGDAAAQGGQLAAVFTTLKNLDYGMLIFGFIIYFILGYLLYASFFAAIGSAVENEADTQQLQLPVTIPLMIAFFIAFYAFKAPESPVVFWASMIPFTSPIVMLARIPFGVPGWELALSIGILVLTFLLCGWASAKIYKIGILMFGKKTSFKDLWKWLKQK